MVFSQGAAHADQILPRHDSCNEPRLSLIANMVLDIAELRVSSYNFRIGGLQIIFMHFAGLASSAAGAKDLARVRAAHVPRLSLACQ